MKNFMTAMLLAFAISSPALGSTDYYLSEIVDNQQTIISLLKKMLGELEDIEYNTF